MKPVRPCLLFAVLLSPAAWAQTYVVGVEDLPFRAVAMRREEGALIFTTDVGDEVRADADNPVVVETDAATAEPRPRVHVRRDLWARIVRPVFYDMVEAAGTVDGRLVLRSAGQAFDLGAVS